MRSGSRVVLLLCTLLGLATGDPALASNATFQTSFTQACMGAVGGMATLCGQTGGGSGDGNLSGSSEDSLNPSQALNAQEGAINNARRRARGIQDRMESQRGENQGSAAAAQAREFLDNVSLYLAGRGSWFDRDSTLNRVGTNVSSGERGGDGTSGGLEFGGDYRITDALVVGGVFSWETIDMTFDADQAGVAFTPASNAGRQDSVSYIFTFFGSYNITDELWVDGFIGGGWGNTDLSRNGVFQESTRMFAPQTNAPTFGNTDATEFNVGGGFGYDFNLGSAALGPYARVSYTRATLDDYTESSAAGLGLVFGSQKRTSLTSVLGLRGSYAISTPWAVFIPQLRVEWEHEYKRDAVDSSSRYLLDTGGARVRTKGDAPDRNTANIGAGIAAVLPDGWMPYLDYQGLFGHEYWKRHRLTGGIRKEF